MGFLERIGVALLVLGLVLRGAGAVGKSVEQYACESASFEFCDSTKDVNYRVEDLISRLELGEKIQQLANTAPSIPRLGIPSYEWWQEALHGVAESPGVTFDRPIKAATSFPQPILTAASFNDTLFNQIGRAVSTEARAMYNTGQSGLTFWSPNVNIFRDPRWGRGQETPGEDPTLSSNYAAQFVRGMQEGSQSDDTNRDDSADFKLKTSTCCKHFSAYDLENWEGVDRDHFDAVVTKQDMEDTYNPPFQSCVQDGRSSGLMCSYNRVNGVPTCARYDLLTETARNNWGFQGYIVSDCDAVYDMCNEPKYAESLEDAVADALLAGLDLNCGQTFKDHAELALNQSKMTEVDIDRALHNLFSVRMRLGLFDGNPESQTYGDLGIQDVCTPEHQELALEAALQSIVLLKNDNDTLPLFEENIESLALVGPSANDQDNRMLGNYAGVPCKYITPTQGLAKFVHKINHQPGCGDPSCEDQNFTGAGAAATETDAVVIVVGLSQTQEREGLDRRTLLLPGHQQELISFVAKVAKGPVILIIMSGGPVDVSFAKDNPSISSILWVGYPGQAGGQAIADIIFGQRNPGGKLPMTWYKESFTEVSMTNMNMRPDNSTGYPGRTHRFYTGQPVFDFGEGLSYSRFDYTIKSATSLILIPTAQQQACYHQRQRSSSKYSTQHCSESDAHLCAHLSFSVEIGVKNEGTRDGSDVLMLYAVPPGSGQGGVPLRYLVNYKRVHLKRGEQYQWIVELYPCRDLSIVLPNGERRLVVGEYLLSVGMTMQHSLKLVDDILLDEAVVNNHKTETPILSHDLFGKGFIEHAAEEDSGSFKVF